MRERDGVAVDGWWAGRNDAERFDLYTRGSLYVLLAGLVFMAAIFGVADASEDRTAAIPAVVLLAAATVLGVRVIGRGLDHATKEAPAPTRELRWYLIVALAAWVAGFLGGDTPVAGGPGTLAGGGIVVLHVLAVVSPLLGWVKLVALGAALATVTGAVVGWLGAEGPVMAATVWMVVVGTGAIVGGFRGSVWMLRIVWELDRSRQIQADLAVAEERLRFSRDLHDVMGRNLSVIAVRSELAAELSRRGRSEEASEQMLGVRGVAQDSMREMRDVVRGYRAVDLGAELAGAGSVLRAAGTATNVTGNAATLPPGVQAVLAWVVREGTTNVIRHAEATTCTFDLTVDGGDAVLTIDNDGTRTTDGPPGSGLAGLTERMTAVGGELRVENDPAAHRFRLVARVPMTTRVTGNADAGLESGAP